ncbi:MAG: class I SAM-dependent methyltransferase [bacterium]
MKEHWNRRYSSQEYIYGTEPNEFFKQEIEKLFPGIILLPGEGEGRNAVYAAVKGWVVDAFDQSEEGKRKALLLAAEKNVDINYVIAGYEDLEFAGNKYDAIGIIFIHVNEEMKTQLAAKTISALKPGGKLIMEVFEKEQLGKPSGGPKEQELLYSLEDVVNMFNELEFEKFTKESVQLDEGNYHKGEASVIRFVGIKPE